MRILCLRVLLLEAEFGHIPAKYRATYALLADAGRSVAFELSDTVCEGLNTLFET